MKSINIQMGEISMISAIKYHKGLSAKAAIKSPLIMETTERVVPQEGQGIFVTCFIKHAST